MKHDSPLHYQRYLESKMASESWREMTRRNEELRRRPSSRSSSSSPLDEKVREEFGEEMDITAMPGFSQDGLSKLRSNNRPGSLQDDPSKVVSKIVMCTTTIESGEDELPVQQSVQQPAFANDFATNSTTNSTTREEEKPWYKQRDDMSDHASDDSYDGAANTTTRESASRLDNNHPPSLGKTTTLPHKSEEEDINDGNISPKKSGGIFSSISKSALNLKDANGTTSTSIPLSELFPTLYSNDLNQTSSNTKKKPVNRAMMHDPISFEAYHAAMTSVLSETSTARTLSKYEARGESAKKVVRQVKEWLLNDTRILEPDVVRERWNTMEDVWRNEKWMTGMSSDSDEEVEEGGNKKSIVMEESRFQLELKAQRKVFLAKLAVDEEETLPDIDNPSLEESESPNNDVLVGAEMDHVLFYDALRNVMGALGRYCARRARSSPMEVAWWKVKESGLSLPKDTISTYLYVVSTMGMADSIGIISSSSTPGTSNSSSSSMGSLSSYPFSDMNQNKGSENEDDDASEENNKFLIPEEVATYHDLSSKPTESSISLRVKSLASKGEAKSAEKMLEAFKKSIETDESSKEMIRLRTYQPILKQYCDAGEISDALSLFQRMQSTSGVILEPETYVLLLASIAENKYFCDDSPPIEGAIDLGYDHSHGPALFDELATEMAADALEITSSSARRLYNALAIGFPNESSSPSSNPENQDTDVVVSTLKEVHPLMSMPITRQLANGNTLVASRVSLDRSTGVCPVTEAQQRLVVLEEDQRGQLHNDLLDLSTEQFTKFAGKMKGKDSADNKAREELQSFSDWLDTREGEPFTAIVDGANIGYYMQSFDKGRFNYHQIKFIVDTLEERGENPLVIIPNKYGYSKFYSAKGITQRLDQTEIQIIEDLAQSGKLYKVPPRCLDDFYWMLASVSDQSASRKGRDLSVSNDNPEGRFPGTRPMLITNDQMRDHKMELLETRLFRRWYGCHIVNYNFTAFVMGESVAGNEVGFSPADFFSREIQGNQCPINSDDEDTSCWGGHAWHFPVNDWELDERFVIRIPAKKQQ